jgi:hypothetical protein
MLEPMLFHLRPSAEGAPAGTRADRMGHDGPGLPGAVKHLSVFHNKLGLYGGFVWARRVLNSLKRRFLARAGKHVGVLEFNAPEGVRQNINRYRSKPAFTTKFLLVSKQNCPEFNSQFVMNGK